MPINKSLTIFQAVVTDIWEYYDTITLFEHSSGYKTILRRTIHQFLYCGDVSVQMETCVQRVDCKELLLIVSY